MAGNYKMTYNVDLVFCIDATGSMDNLIDTVKNNAFNFYGDLIKTMQEKDKVIQQVRVRVIAFRDYLADGEEAMMMSDFFNLPEQAGDFKECLSYIQANGGGDIPEDSLEAIAYAIKSEWNTSGIKKRHVVVLWTDAPAHPIGYGKASPEYPENMAQSFDELTKWWGDMQHGGFMDQHAKRMIMFAPEFDDEKSKTPSVWRKISREWDQAILSPVDLEKGLINVGYETILHEISNTI
jgi:hypothetical protein